MRTHISLPEDLVKEIDAIAGPRNRSAFIEEAVRRKLMNERQKRALAALAESPGLDPENTPTGPRRSLRQSGFTTCAGQIRSAPIVS